MQRLGTLTLSVEPVAVKEWGDLHRAAPGNRRERGRVSQSLRTAVGDLLILAQCRIYVGKHTD
jgi:hypothetical protein